MYTFLSKAFARVVSSTMKSTLTGISSLLAPSKMKTKRRRTPSVRRGPDLYTSAESLTVSVTPSSSRPSSRATRTANPAKMGRTATTTLTRRLTRNTIVKRLTSRAPMRRLQVRLTSPSFWRFTVPSSQRIVSS